jgi:uncharacterized membrane protein
MIMAENDILDRDLVDDESRLERFWHYTKWAKRFSWISVIILFAFVFMSGVLIPVFNNNSDSALQFLTMTAGMIIAFLILLTISNLFSLYFRIRGFNMLAHRQERDYFQLIISLLFLVAPFILLIMFFGLPVG